jgi:hypothetical protein
MKTYKIYYQLPDARNTRRYDAPDYTRTTINSQTHALLKEIKAENLDDAYDQMQGENWSPRGEARELIVSKGLDHTSMMVEDIIRDGKKFFIVENSGFRELK